jgi:hypothetical protein
MALKKVQPLNKKALDTQQKKIGKMESVDFQKGFKQGLKSAKNPKAYGNAPEVGSKRNQGYNAAVVSSRQDRAKSNNRSK